MNRTKLAIVDTLWQLLEEKSYHKITVQDIVDHCRVNRNTFDYHFQDIPSLTDDLLAFCRDFCEMFAGSGETDFLRCAISGERRREDA